MFSPPFDYYRAQSIADVHRLLQAHPGAKLLAGGHSLIPLLKLRLAQPAALVDIGRLRELREIAAGGDGLRVGALVTHAELAASADVQRSAPALADAAGAVGDPQVRNRGTIGGNVAHADPASDLPAVLVALGARFVAAGPQGERTIEAAGFFQGLMTTALRADELLTTVIVRAPPRGQGQAYEKFRHPASGYAVVGVAASVTLRDGACEAASVVAGGLVAQPTRLGSVEGALAGRRLTDAVLRDAAAKAADDVGTDVMGDLFASAEYRRAVLGVYARRAIAAAMARAAA
jgi:carbon-monoxide dehydrogenase medium subunit